MASDIKWGIKPTDINNYYKLVCIGDKNVGKSQFISYVDESKDIISGIKGTKNSNKRIKILKLNKQLIRLHFYEYEEKQLGGGIDRSYFQNTACFYLMFDLTDEDSLHSCKIWLRDIIKYSRANTPIILIGNKVDLKIDRKVEVNHVKEFIFITSDQLKINQELPYFEISALESNDKIFNKIFKKSYQLINERFNIKTSPSSSPPKNNNNNNSNSNISNNNNNNNNNNSNNNGINNISSLRISNEESVLSKRGSMFISKISNLLKKE